MFAKAITFPARERAPVICLANRIRNKSGTHIKAFASETLYLITVVWLFCDSLRHHLGHLSAEIQCFSLLFRITQLLRRGMVAGERLSLLRRLVLDHHARFCELYPQCPKPKLHYMLHIPECIARFGVVLSCFCPERKHKRSNQLGQFAFRNFAETITRRILRREIAALRVPGRFLATKLDESRPLTRRLKQRCVQCGLLSLVGGEAAPAARQSIGLHTAVGHVHRQDLICAVVGREMFVGLVQNFVQRMLPGGDDFWAFVTVLRPVGGCTFGCRPHEVLELFLPAESVRFTMPHVTRNGRTWALFPPDL